MDVTLRYGQNGLNLDFPDNWDITVVQKKSMPVLTDPSEAVAKALEHPSGCEKLPALVSGKQRACILICDITRPVPNGLILPVLIKQLINAGLERDQIQILVATGLHRPNQGKELREIVGDNWVADNIIIGNHYARNDLDHINIGNTKAGTPVKLDRRFIEADLHPY